MVILTKEQHERVWEIVAQCLPEKVAEDPELHEAAARIASALELGPNKEVKPVRWLVRTGVGLVLFGMSLFMNKAPTKRGE